MAEMFACQKAECAPKDAEKISEALYQFVKAEVVKSANSFKRELKGEPEPVKVEPPKKKDMSNFYAKKDEKQSVRNNVMADEAADLLELGAPGTDGKWE